MNSYSSLFVLQMDLKILTGVTLVKIFQVQFTSAALFSGANFIKRLQKKRFANNQSNTYK